ncbi:MAG: aldo/keto reductase family protein [Planctomycetes bacterium]|nr:aldo/keto reductase family protein [Planctomycetota bacterium]
MQYRQLGRHGLRVSALSIGGWITFGGSLGSDETRAVVHESIEQGMNFVDLADVYARGNAELVAGEVLSDYRREDLVISSKVYWPMGTGINDRGLGRKHIRESIDASLQRLGVDYLDIYFCHRFDPETPLEETVVAMDDLIRAGKILYWGTSVWEADQLRDAHAIADRRNRTGPAVEQPRYNLLDRHIEAAIQPAALELGMGLVLWSPLAQGMLTGKYDDTVPAGSRGATTEWLQETLTDANRERSRRFTALCRELEHAPGAIALAWLLTRDGVSSAITGATRPEQVRENCAALSIELDAATLRRIEACFD